MNKPQYISLSEWAARRHAKPPSAYILRQWREAGEIYPPPERVGKEWQVLETAERMTTARPVGGGLLRQMV